MIIGREAAPLRDALILGQVEPMVEVLSERHAAALARIIHRQLTDFGFSAF